MLNNDFLLSNNTNSVCVAGNCGNAWYFCKCLGNSRISSIAKAFPGMPSHFRECLVFSGNAWFPQLPATYVLNRYLINVPSVRFTEVHKGSVSFNHFWNSVSLENWQKQKHLSNNKFINGAFLETWCISTTLVNLPLLFKPEFFFHHYEYSKYNLCVYIVMLFLLYFQ